jgi:uncharacterized membrane protein
MQLAFALSACVSPINSPSGSRTTNQKLSTNVPEPCSCTSRRRFVLQAAALTGATSLLQPTEPVQAEEGVRAWADSELCSGCRGCGEQPCRLCNGKGILEVEDGVVPFDTVCPNCEGKAVLRCLKCLGLGLADTRGILRNGTSHVTWCEPAICPCGSAD